PVAPRRVPEEPAVHGIAQRRRRHRRKGALGDILGVRAGVAARSLEEPERGGHGELRGRGIPAPSGEAAVLRILRGGRASSGIRKLSKGGQVGWLGGSCLLEGCDDG